MNESKTEGLEWRLAPFCSIFRLKPKKENWLFRANDDDNIFYLG